MENLSGTFEAFTFNQKLLELYGRHVESNTARFRVVHSGDQLEKRFGTFDVYNGSTYLRTEENVIREMPKYGHLDNQWVIERLEPNVHQDVYDGDFIYECLWALPTGLPLNWEAVDVVVKASLDMLSIDKAESGIPRTQKQAEEIHKEELAKESELILDKFSDESLTSALHFGSAVSMTRTKE